jgi:hypothetical protein
MVRAGPYSFSNPKLRNRNVRLFSETVRTRSSGAPSVSCAWISSVTVTLAPTWPARCWMTSSAIYPASRETRCALSSTVPW